MKKPMKFKRYDEGGEVADKEAGLKASKDEDVGFFKRLRMGNIDDPTSEAYKRLGAGRGRAERTPVDESVSVNEPMPMPMPMPVARPSMKTTADDMYSDYGVKAGRGSAGTSETISPSAATPAVKPSMPKPVTASRPKINTTAVTEVKPPAPKVTDTGDQGERLLARYKKPPLRQETMNERAKRFIEKREAAKREKEANRGRGRGGVPYEKGGMVSSASKRADGIATKGKTRGKMC